MAWRTFAILAAYVSGVLLGAQGDSRGRAIGLLVLLGTVLGLSGLAAVRRGREAEGCARQGRFGWVERFRTQALVRTRSWWWRFAGAADKRGAGRHSWRVRWETACPCSWLGQVTPWIVAGVLLAAVGGMARGQQALAGAMSPPLKGIGEVVLSDPSVSGPVVVEGRLRGDAEPTDYGIGFSLAVEHLEWGTRRLSAPGGLRVGIGGEIGRARAPEWRDGRRVRLPVTLRAPQAYRNPGVPDQGRALALRGTTWLASVKSGALVELRQRGSLVQEVAGAARAHARRSIRASLGVTGAAADSAPAQAGEWPDSGDDREGARQLSAAIVTAILIGDRAGIPNVVTDRLQRAGTFHVIAISGGNIAILTALVLGFWRAVRVPGRFAAVLTAVGVAGYGLIAAGSASVARATVVAILYLLARVLDVRADGFAVLWTGLLLLLIDAPLDVFDAGFLLTSGATVGILLSAQAVAREPSGAEATSAPWLARTWARTARWLGSVVRATVAADVMLLPIGAWLFSRVTAAGILLNPLAIPLMTVVQVCGLAIVALSGVAPALATGAGSVAHAAVRGLLSSAALVDLWPALSWRVPPPSVTVVAIYYLAWGAWFAILRGGHRRRALVLLPVCLACAVWVATAPQAAWSAQASLPPFVAGSPRAGQVSLVFLDVGQGDATVLRFPSGRTWIVDAGGIPGASTFDVGARVVAPSLWSLGVRALDVMALTHPDPDHVGGAPSLIADFAPHEVWEGVPVLGHPLLERIRDAASKSGSTWRRRRRGEGVEVEGVVVRVMHPAEPEWERRRTRNDDSLTLEVRYRDVRVILPGDIGASVEEGLAGAVEPAGLTVLKVPHHGGAGSSSPGWLDALRPGLAVVSAGRDNRFGHPAPATVMRYAERNIPLLRTDTLGAVAVVTDGTSVVASSWDGRGWGVRWRGRAPAGGAPRGVTR